MRRYVLYLYLYSSVAADRGLRVADGRIIERQILDYDEDEITAPCGLRSSFRQATLAPKKLWRMGTV